MGRQITTRYQFEPDYAVPPGATLQETIEALGMTQRDLSRRTGMAPKTINEIITGKAPITPTTSIFLERVTGVSAQMWNGLEVNYREQLARRVDRDRLSADLAWLKTIPAKELIRRGQIQSTSDEITLLHEVLRFFGVASSSQWKRLWNSSTWAFRRSPNSMSRLGAIATWLRLGEIQAHNTQTEPFDKGRFRLALDEIRKLTVEPGAAFEHRMIQHAADAGVAIVLVPEIRACPIFGAARWLTPQKALIQLSLRYKTNDQFWFTLFHEAGHVLNDRKKGVYIDTPESTDNDNETQANRFAADFLIPQEHQSRLPQLKVESQITQFAHSIEIAPGIIVGRLQKEGLIPWATKLNRLKLSFHWAGGSIS